MKGWFSLVLLLLARSLSLAQTSGDAARDLARQIAGSLHEPASLNFQNLSDLGAAGALETRRALETELRASGVRLLDAPAPSEVRVTLSQNLASYLLVAEVRRGDERRVLMAPWPRPPQPPLQQAAASIQKTLILETPEPILDLARADDDLLLFQPARISRLDRQSGHWEARESAAVPSRPWPRDLRGRLMLQGASFLAYLPGLICGGAVRPLDARCRDADEPWPGEIRVSFSPGRNYFDGRVMVAPGVRKTLPPFYSAAGTEEPGGRLWLFAALDGRVHLYDSAFAPAGSFSGWGSDMAAVLCGTGSVVLATRPGGGGEKDAVHVYRIVERQAADTGAEVEMPGPVTALWPAAGNGALAVSRDLASGAYAAFSLALACGP